MKRCRAAALCIIVSLTIMSSASAEASGGVPGSAADPLVTQSYVDDKYNGLYGLIEIINNRIGYGSNSQTQSSGTLSTQERNAIIEEIFFLMMQQNTADASAYSTYTPVYASTGQVILGGEGTEMILRSGSAAAYVTGSNGLSDITEGVDILNGGTIKLNHLLIVARNDGRGVRVINDAWFLIKGTYTMSY